MADLAVGLSKTVVAEALTKVQSAIDEDNKLRHKAQRDLVTITLEFEMMQSFLNVANGGRAAAMNNLVRTWVRHVRELAYDLEDCVEFVVHLDGKPVFWRRLLPACVVGPLPLDQAVAEIEVIKGRAEELSACYSRYSCIGEPVSNLVMLQQQQASGRAADAAAADMLVEARDSAKRQQFLGDLAQLITNKDKDLQVISVWGTCGDLGTTSIIRKAYNDPEICRSFACRVWVKLMHPFNPHEFVRRFMAQVYAADACVDKEGADVGVHVLTKMEAMQEDVGVLRREFVQEVNTKTYLVVLENLTDMVDWDAVRTFLPDMKNGSWIIVSTQQFEIASLCIGHAYQPLELKQYSPEHSVCAFFKEGSQDYGPKEEKPVVCEVSSNLSLEKIPSSNIKGIEDWMENYPLVGRELEMNELRSYTARARFSNSPVISVWGIAGIGKSALVRTLYYDRMLHSNQFNKYSWVDVSHPFNLRDFSRSLLLDHHSEKDPIKECRELLSQNQCLVVIDDLQSKEEWDLIQSALVSRPSSSVIIVITTEASVATYCTNNEGQVFNVKGLEAVAAMDLFRKEVHRKNPSSPLKDHEDMELEELILKCGGLPKVIVSIAALLATQTVTLMDTVRSLNQKFMQHLETNPDYECLKGLFDWMHSYFRTCPDSLKPCIFYLSIFPRHHGIRQRRLVRRWIAEGYCRDSDEESAVDRGENFFSKLLELSIIQQIPQLVTTAYNDTSMVSCQVNGFIREYIVSRRMEENLVFELGPKCVLTTHRTGRHLIILRDWDRDKIVFESITRLQKLQYIHAGTTVRASALPAPSSRLPKFHRRRGLFGIKVPKGIGKLTVLHTLGVVDVGASGGKAVVEELRKLTQLRKLGVSGISRHNSKDFFSATSGLVHLESLLVRLGKDSQGCLDEITLPWENLRSLTLHGLQDKLPPSENLSKLMKLDLEMDALKEDDIEFLANLSELCILRLRVGQLQDGKLHFHAKMYGEELVTFKKVKILEIASGASELHVTFGSRSMKSLELLKIDCSSASYHLTGLNFLSELKEVLLQGTNDEAIKSNLESQLANHPKAPTVKLEELPRSS
ncbi:unnamed protein product [Triticum turgidum subsp. durum]|uniref:Disease resistance protein RPM1 n=1 Tax=Triticum turgidum subsp. durum TaxID=4567 RepID=A0A9R1AC85_TRITD|nr:unnamed protein product [Triticum turgidum subsp. durum]